MKSLRTITLSNTHLTGFLPKDWSTKLTHIDFSRNKLKGTIPTSLNVLKNLKVLNFSSNNLIGVIPDSFGGLVSLEKLSLSSNSLSGPIPGSMSNILGLVHLDLGSNQLNGVIPEFISEMRELKYLNLENNRFHGVLPFNESFIKKLDVFKITGNEDLCYNHLKFSKDVRLGIASCDKHGMPVLPQPPKTNETSSWHHRTNTLAPLYHDRTAMTLPPQHHCTSSWIGHRLLYHHYFSISNFESSQMAPTQSWSLVWFGGLFVVFHKTGSSRVSEIVLEMIELRELDTPRAILRQTLRVTSAWNTFGKKSHPESGHFSPDGQFLVSCSVDGFIERRIFTSRKNLRLVYSDQSVDVVNNVASLKYVAKDVAKPVAKGHFSCSGRSRKSRLKKMIC
ncbi:hypothetical protein CTI12_AA078890 [Artemisia annua]|uniref:Uncharacterized protein n=1 Tax=Artemisia annua TaxID=35608 RepID=A0A2U1Q3G1_ARTAN|nr:hypothetical protein CTI12_AA078890 [Artemisia annua]